MAQKLFLADSETDFVGFRSYFCQVQNLFLVGQKLTLYHFVVFRHRNYLYRVYGLGVWTLRRARETGTCRPRRKAVGFNGRGFAR